jgi:hypothetical protein
VNIAMLYGFWHGEPWSTPLGVQRELIRRGHTVYDFNLFADDGSLRDRNAPRRYSPQGLWSLIYAIRRGEIDVDVLLHMDCGVFDNPALDKAFFGNDMVWLLEAGDTPQSFVTNGRLATRFDITLTPDKPTAMRWREQGVNAKWWTHFADHHVFRPYPDERVQWEVVTTCGDRRVTDAVQVALADQYHDGRFVWGEEYGRLLNRGNIVFQCSQHREVTRRVFEGMACGKLVVTDRLPASTAIEDLFTDGEDVVYYDDAAEAIDKLRYYIAHPDDRERIARNGYRKVMEAHTVAHRVDFLEAEVEAWRARST